MASKLELVIEDDVGEVLARLVPLEEQSSFATEALKARLELLRRQDATSRLEELRRKGPHVSTSEVVRLVRQVRDEQ